jgi:uncharacterized protein (DUF4415 family)
VTVNETLYRPLKKKITLLIDADVLEWLQQDGPGYQTKINGMLRDLMRRAMRRVQRNKRAKRA